MSQSRLDRAVARATGESLATIRRLGFGYAVRSSPKPAAGPRAKGVRRGPNA